MDLILAGVLFIVAVIFLAGFTAYGRDTYECDRRNAEKEGEGDG